jgi:hypothetical protein
MLSGISFFRQKLGFIVSLTMTSPVGQGYGLADHLPIFERQSIANGYRFSNNHQIHYGR